MPNRMEHLGSYEVIIFLVRRAVYNGIKCEILLQSSLAIWGWNVFELLQGIEQKVQLIQVTIFNTHHNFPVLGREDHIILTLCHTNYMFHCQTFLASFTVSSLAIDIYKIQGGESYNLQHQGNYLDTELVA